MGIFLSGTFGRAIYLPKQILLLPLTVVPVQVSHPTPAPLLPALLHAHVPYHLHGAGCLSVRATYLAEKEERQKNENTRPAPPHSIQGKSRVSADLPSPYT